MEDAASGRGRRLRELDACLGLPEGRLEVEDELEALALVACADRAHLHAVCARAPSGRRRARRCAAQDAREAGEVDAGRGCLASEKRATRCVRLVRKEGRDVST